MQSLQKKACEYLKVLHTRHLKEIDREYNLGLSERSVNVIKIIADRLPEMASKEMVFTLKPQFKEQAFSFVDQLQGAK